MPTPPSSFRELHPLAKVLVTLLGVAAALTILGCLAGVAKWVWFVAFRWMP
jgi:hypothetical protein